jgi:hypothetical protein
MVQVGENMRLELELLLRLLRRVEILLHGDLFGAQALVVGQVDGPHSAAA